MQILRILAFSNREGGLFGQSIDVIPLIERQQKILNEVIAPHYEGLFGVDLLVTADGRINPCVEINLRRTMGHATLAWWKETEQRGLFPAIVFT